MTVALVIFSPDNQHPLAWMLSGRHRHVWVSVLDIDRCTWSSYDWGQGNPKIQFDAVADYDLETYWRSHGFTVVAINTGNALPWGPWMLNNCVGHTKLIIGLRTLAVTPDALYRVLTGTTYTSRFFNWIRSLTLLPGFGGKKSKPQPQVAPEGYRFVNVASKTESSLNAAGNKYQQMRIDADGDRNLQNRVAGKGPSGFTQYYSPATDRQLELIPGYTQAGPDTAPGFKDGPPGAAAPPPIAEGGSKQPPPKLTASQAKVGSKKAPRKLSSGQAGSGSSAAGGTALLQTGDLSDATTANRSLLG